MKKKRLRFIVYCSIIFAIFLVTFLSCAPDIIKIHNTKKEINELKEKYNKLLSEEDKLSEDVVKLQDSEYAAKYAREKYLYTKDGELIIDLSKNEEE
jgi:cell division protein DivIC